MLLSDGSCGTIISVEVEQLATPETTYNFEVADFHTYFVGNFAICVHNKCGGDYKKYSPDQIADRYDISVDDFHKQVKPEIIRQCKPNYKVGSNPDILLNKSHQIAYQGAKGFGFQETGLNILDILSKLIL